MAYWRLHYYVVWGTKGRVPSVRSDEGDEIAAVIKAAFPRQGVIVHTVEVMPDQVYVAASVLPALALVEVIGRWKGATSHLRNQWRTGCEDGRFAWQGDYGVLSFGEKVLPDVIASVANQAERHRDRELCSCLECDR